jgi:hypothetical protein
MRSRKFGKPEIKSSEPEGLGHACDLAGKSTFIGI